MGLETSCEVRWQGNTWNAAVHLDSTALEVRGRPRLVFPLKQIRSVQPLAGELELLTDSGTLTVVLGAAVPAWARKIQAPPTRIAKLGVKAEQRVSVLGLEDAAFRAELEAAGARRVAARDKADMVIIGVDEVADLARLAGLRERIEPDGAIWVVRVKGKAASVRENEVREAARAAGLVDVKVAAFSETHSADKLVIPAAARSTARSGPGEKRPTPRSSPRAPTARKAASSATKRRGSRRVKAS